MKVKNFFLYWVEAINSWTLQAELSIQYNISLQEMF